MPCKIAEEYIVSKVRVDFELANTLDTYLIKLSSLILLLKDVCVLEEDTDKCINRCLAHILVHTELINYTKLLSCYYRDIQQEISSSPRHKLIRAYWGTIGSILKVLPCRKWKHLSLRRPSLKQLERRDTGYSPITLSTAVRRDKFEEKFRLKHRSRVRHTSPRKDIYAILAVSILLLILFLPLYKQITFQVLIDRDSSPVIKTTRELNRTLSTSIYESSRLFQGNNTTTRQAIKPYSSPLTTSPIHIIGQITESTYEKKYSLDKSSTTPTPIYRDSVNVYDTNITINGTQLVISYSRREKILVWLEIGEKRIFLPYFYTSNNDIYAIYLRITSSNSTIIYPIEPIINLISRYGTDSKVYIRIEPSSLKCQLHIINNTLKIGKCERKFLIVISHGKSILDVLLEDINSSSIINLRKNFLNSFQVNNSPVIYWEILKWLDENTEYDYIRAMLADMLLNVKDPLEFLRERSGICSDYAVFTVAVLLAAGAEKVYILSIETAENGHAFAAVEINGSLFAMDQHLPIYEIEDYFEYVFTPIDNTIELYIISMDNNGLTVIEKIITNTSNLVNQYPDKYPTDKPPPTLLINSVKKAAQLLGIKYSTNCRANYYIKYPNIRDWEFLKAYSPMFGSKFEEYLAHYIANTLAKRGPISCISGRVVGDTLFIYIEKK